MWEKLYSKNGLAAKYIAEEFIGLETGEKIPRVSDYSAQLGFGRGTVQIALGLLEDMKAIKLEARGHLGTYLMDKDISLLQEIAGISPLIGSMPLPYSRKYEGLATGLVEAFELAGKSINLSYMRGGLNRIEMVRTKRSDFAIVSKMTADHTLSKFPNLKVMKSLGRNSYVSAHKIFLADSSEKVVKDGMRVGVDTDSLDQKELTFSEFADLKVQYVHVNYMQLFEMLRTRQIDAAVWNTDDRRMIQDFKPIDFQSTRAKQISEQTSEAAIIIESEREAELIEKWNAVEIQKILEVQKNVENGDKIPRY